MDILWALNSTQINFSNKNILQQPVIKLNKSLVDQMKLMKRLKLNTQIKEWKEKK